MDRFSHSMVFTNEELSLIYKALEEMKYREAAPVINTINLQLQAEAEEDNKNITGEFKDEQ